MSVSLEQQFINYSDKNLEGNADYYEGKVILRQLEKTNEWIKNSSLFSFQPVGQSMMCLLVQCKFRI